MNRHIWGITLFLIIVKIHFLLYWALFTPVNFFSAQPVLINQPVTNLETKKCNSMRCAPIKLQNVEINFRDGIVFANLKTELNLADFEKRQIRLQLFDEDKQFVWASDVENTNLKRNASTFIFTDCSHNLNQLNEKKNYYARIYEPDISITDYFRVENLSDLTPILQSSKSFGIGCGYGTGYGYTVPK